MHERVGVCEHLGALGVQSAPRVFFAIPGLVLVRDAVWHVVVCSQYRHDRGGL